MDENGEQLEATVAEVHRCVSANDLDGIGKLKDALDSLIAEQGVITHISTWPWSTGTLSALGTALILPLALLIVQRILEQLFP